MRVGAWEFKHPEKLEEGVGSPTVRVIIGGCEFLDMGAGSQRTPLRNSVRPSPVQSL